MYPQSRITPMDRNEWHPRSPERTRLGLAGMRNIQHGQQTHHKGQQRANVDQFAQNSDRDDRSRQPRQRCPQVMLEIQGVRNLGWICAQPTGGTSRPATWKRRRATGRAASPASRCPTRQCAPICTRAAPAHAGRHQCPRRLGASTLSCWQGTMPVSRPATSDVQNRTDHQRTHNANGHIPLWILGFLRRG